MQNKLIKRIYISIFRLLFKDYLCTSYMPPFPFAFIDNICFFLTFIIDISFSKCGVKSLKFGFENLNMALMAI